MASRVKKTTTTTVTQHTSSGAETPHRSATSPRRERAASPARTTRIQEKDQLINLNDRLAAYIDRVRFLEGENSRLQIQIRKSEEVVSKEVTNVRSLYENELADARKLLDDTSKEKAKLQIDIGKYKSQAEDWQTKFHRKDRDLQNAEKKILALEGQVADLQGKLADEENRRKHFEKECNNLKLELAQLERQLAQAKKQLEDETLQRVDLENRVQSLKEDIAFKSQVFEQTINETRVKTQTYEDEVEGKTQAEYEARLQDALQDIRDQHEEQMLQVRRDLEDLYEPRVQDLQNKIQRYQDDSSMYRDELVKTKRRIDDISSELTKLRAQNADYEARIRDLENQLAREQKEFRDRLDIRDQEIKELQLALEEQTLEYSDLLDIKIRLDREIEAYRKLLEGEEERLNMSQTSSPTPRKKGSVIKVTSGRKRKRLADTVEEYTQSASSSGYQTQSSSSGAVEITDFDTDNGKYVNITNSSDKDIHVGGWQIKHAAKDQETSYKFHRSIVLKAGNTISVWSSDSGQTHSPPGDLVMKGQRWFVADEMQTSLQNQEGDQVASREMQKSILRSATSFKSNIIHPDEVDSGTEDAGDKEKCAIM